MKKQFELMLQMAHTKFVGGEGLCYGFDSDALLFMKTSPNLPDIAEGERYELYIDIFLTGEVYLSAAFLGKPFARSGQFDIDTITVGGVMNWVHSFDWDEEWAKSE